MGHLFMYGTLKRSQPIHYMLQDMHKKHGALLEFLGHVQTVNKYPLVVIDQWQTPLLLNRPGVGRNITGELYTLRDKVIEDLDFLENIPDWYIRTQVPVQMIPGCEGPTCAYQNDKDCWTNNVATMKTESGEANCSTPVEATVYIMEEFKPDLLSMQTHGSFQVKEGFTYDYLKDYDNYEDLAALFRKACKDP